MSDKIATAVKGVKAIDAEIVQWENRLGFVQDEVKRLSDTKEKMQSEIDQKTAYYNIYIAQKDNESKRMRQEQVESQEQLAKDKSDFMEILTQFKAEKDAFEEEKKGSENLKAQYEDKMNNVRQFIIAVQRAFSLLG